MNVLITGGTGSVGKVLATLLLRRPEVKKVMIYSRDEHKQERLDRGLRIYDTHYKLRFFIGDVRDKPRLVTAMRDATHVIHTAALKIVPAMEYNPQEAIKTNILGTQNALEAAGECGVSNFITLSTDKAVHPVNLYGATKLCAEKLTISTNNIYPDSNFNVVRYGNVALSNGSVIPLFHRWCCEGLPLEITNMDMTRFWITLDDAAKFVIDKLYSPHGSKELRGMIYVPDMDAYHMTDLIKIFSTEGVENKITGVRPGEKIHEQIITDSEALRASVDLSGVIIAPEWFDYKPTSLGDVVKATRSNTTHRIPVDELRRLINKEL